MNENTKINIVIIILFFVSIFLGINYPIISEQPVINLTCEETICPEPRACVMPELSCPPTQLPDITCPTNKKHIILDPIASVPYDREYNPGVYDCTEMSQEIIRRLENIGFTAQMETGTIDCDYFLCVNTNLHDFVKLEIYIEPTTGLIIHPDEYEYYRGIK